MRVDSLASGSSGNAYLVRMGGTALLVEAGLSARRLKRHLASVGCDPSSLSGILLTHAHSDHMLGARQLSDAYQIPIYATVGTLGQRDLRDSPLARPIQAGRVVELPEVEITPYAVPHDCVEPVGFRLQTATGTACIATDLGFVPEAVQLQLEGVDLMILEANHDEKMLWAGRYPGFLKQRVAGEHGHLSNRAAAECLAGLRKPPEEIWLAHLSLINNRAELAAKVIRDAFVRLGGSSEAVQAAGRNQPSLSWDSELRSRQLTLF